MERSDELRDLMLRFCDALSSGDKSFLDRHISQDAAVRGIGTDPEEWWSGAHVTEIWKQQIDAMGGAMPVQASDPEAYVEGSVGWAADRMTVPNPDGADLSIRFTGVFHKENGDWKMVQSHGSIGVGNEDTFGEDLPT